MFLGSALLPCLILDKKRMWSLSNIYGFKVQVFATSDRAWLATIFLSIRCLCIFKTLSLPIVECFCQAGFRSFKYVESRSDVSQVHYNLTPSRLIIFLRFQKCHRFSSSL